MTPHNQDTWTTLAATMPRPRYRHAAVVVGTKIYLFGDKKTTHCHRHRDRKSYQRRLSFSHPSTSFSPYPPLLRG